MAEEQLEFTGAQMAAIEANLSQSLYTAVNREGEARALTYRTLRNLAEYVFRFGSYNPQIEELVTLAGRMYGEACHNFHVALAQLGAVLGEEEAEAMLKLWGYETEAGIVRRKMREAAGRGPLPRRGVNGIIEDPDAPPGTIMVVERGRVFRPDSTIWRVYAGCDWGSPKGANKTVFGFGDGSGVMGYVLDDVDDAAGDRVAAAHMGMGDVNRVIREVLERKHTFIKQLTEGDDAGGKIDAGGETWVCDNHPPGLEIVHDVSVAACYCGMPRKL